MSFADITKQKNQEMKLGNTISLLTKPMTDSESIGFLDLFEIEKIQKLQDDFSTAIGVASIITQPDGTPITEPSNFTHLFKHLIGSTRIGSPHTKDTDAEIEELSIGGGTLKPCFSSGLLSAEAGISVGKEHIANWLIGQVREKGQSENTMREFVRTMGINEEQFIKAFHEIPEMTREEFHKYANLLFTFSGQLSEIAFKNVEQAKSIKALRYSEKSLRKLGMAIRQSPSSIVLTDKEGNIEYVNEKFCKITGYEKAEVIGQNPRILKSDILEDLFYTDMWDTLSKGNEWRGTFHNKKKNGELYWEDAVISPIFDENGAIVNYIASKEDVTEKMKVEKEKEMLLSAIEQTHDIVEILDLEGRLLYVNNAFVEKTGYTKEEVLGKKPLDIFSEGSDQNAEIDSELWKTIKNGSTWRGRFQNRTKFGDFTIDDVSISPVKDNLGRVISYTSVKRNVTETIKLEQEKNRIKEQLFQSQKLESIGQLTSVIAHDFNNILSGIMSVSQLLLLPKRNLDEKSRKYAKMILSSCERAADITSRLLHFSQKNKTTFKPIQLNAIIDETIILLKYTIKKSISIEHSIVGQSFTINGDYSAIQSALMNIFINSNHAIEGIGQIKLELSETCLDQKFCELSKFKIQAGQYCLVKISDTGSGIAPEDLKVIFDAFFTTKDKGLGTGLGLPSVLTIVEDHKGAIEVESTPGEGTTFSLFFPKL